MEINILREGYFLIDSANSCSIHYHEITYCRTEQEMYEYLDSEFGGTDNWKIASMSIDELMQGVPYDNGHRQGTSKSKMALLLVHDTNIEQLFSYLNEAEIYDDDDERVHLGTYMRDAKTEDEIEDIINMYNESWDSVW